MLSAIQKGASDIHIEPYEKEMRVRFRIDGAAAAGDGAAAASTATRSSRASRSWRGSTSPKSGCRRTAASRRGSYDRGTHRDIDFRVSVAADAVRREGRAAPARSRGAAARHDASSGSSRTRSSGSTRAIRKPWGMVLVTGPTGSGKTNTLYSSLAQINQPGVNIMTAEDPVEFNLPGINQVQVRENIGLTFAQRPAVVPAPGPEHHSRRRNPRRRDGVDRRQGGAHRPPGAVDAAHQRRAEQHQPARQHGRRAVSRRQLASTSCARSGSCGASASTARTPHDVAAAQLIEAGLRRRRRPRRRSRRRAAAATAAAAPATRAASACSRSWR